MFTLESNSDARPFLLVLGRARSSKRSDTNSFLVWLGKLGEQYVNLQTGDINNVDSGQKRHVLRMVTTRTYPDSVDFSSGGPPIISEVKVGLDLNIVQALVLANSVEIEESRAGIIHFLESPAGRVGTIRGVKGIFMKAGFSLVYTMGPWWEFLQTGIAIPTCDIRS